MTISLKALSKGNYYIFGGRHSSGKIHTDVWSVDLRNPQKGWRRLGDAPWPLGTTDTSHFKCVVYKKRAYIFSGNCCLLLFDLSTETWEERYHTTMKDPSLDWRDVWSGISADCSKYTADVIGNKMYLFGGRDSVSYMGRDMLLSLDLTAEPGLWEVHSGTQKPTPNGGVLPGLRQCHVSWTLGPKLYIAFGSADRWQGVKFNDPQASYLDFGYGDMWSYDTRYRIWKKEKLRGNLPAARTEAGYTHNQKWKSVVVFGGFCPDVPFFSMEKDTKGLVNWSYVADTFIWSTESSRWSMVVCKGFPAYRSYPDLITDQETGRSYLFGGRE